MLKARFTLGEVVDLRLPHVKAFVAITPKIVEQVLLTQSNRFTKQTRGYDQLRRVLGNGLLTSEGSFWLRQRRLAQPAFHRERLHALGVVMVRATNELVASWAPHLASRKPFDVSTEMMKVTLRIVGETLLSSNVSAESDRVTRALSNGLETMQYTLTHPFSPPAWVPTAQNRRIHAAEHELNDVVMGVIAERRRGVGPKDDLLGMLMSAVDADTHEQMNDEQLRDEVLTIMLAGHETTAVLLSWALYLLSLHPDIERRVRAELAQVLNGRDPTAADAPKFEFLNRVIKEVLRLYPPAWILARRVTEDTVIDGWNLPKRSVLLISTYVLHRLPETFSNPEGFDPDRWLHEDELPRGAYVPFSLGPRKCIGDSFAQLEAALILATLLPKVRLDWAPGQPAPEPEPMITLRPRNGIVMSAVPPPPTPEPAHAN